MADIEFNCPKCGKHLSVDGKGAGLEVPCPECNRMIQVPDAMPDEGKSKAKPSGRIFNITILLSALVLAGGLVGSAYLLQQGMAGLGESVVKGLRYSRVDSVTLNHKAGFTDFRIRADVSADVASDVMQTRHFFPNTLALRHYIPNTLDINFPNTIDLAFPKRIDINHHTDNMMINHSGHISQ